MRRIMSSLTKVLSLFAFIAVGAIMANAQFGSSVQGVVTDSTGSVVPGATVSLTNPETNQVLQSITNESGIYRFSNLVQGTYKIVVSKAGFKKRLVANAVVAAESQARFDAVLEPGEVSAEVTIDASDNAPLETESSNISRNITTKELIDLPQVGRDPYNLVRLAPGVFGDGARSANGQSNRIGNNGTGPGGSNNGIFAVENQVQVSANGQRVTSNNFEIDGVSVNSQTWGGAAVITPSQESIAEVQVTSSTYSAEDGRNSGAQVKVITKYGTNRWSGSAFLKLNNPGLNAYNSFRGIPGVTGLTNLNPTRVNDKFKTFGGSFGGPVVKDKLFFFASYEGTRSVGNSISGPTFFETGTYRQQIASLRSGTISAAYMLKGSEPRVAQVLSASPTGVTNLCSLLSAPYNTGGTNCQLVGGGLDIGSITGTFGTYVPDASNSLGGGLDGIPDLQYGTLYNLSRFRGNQYTARVDYQLTSKDKIAFTTNFTPLSTYGSNSAAQSRPQADLSSDRITYLVGGVYSRTISPTTLNEFRFNMTKWKFNEIEANPDTDFGLPRIEIEAVFGDRIRFGAPRAETTPGFFDQRQMDFRDILTNVRGNHTLKFGFEYRKELNNSAAPGGARPLYSFTKMWNFANGTPVFESINADATGTPKANDVPFHTANMGAFVQDNWKYRSNLTLNLGLRWEYFVPISVSNGNQLGRLILGTSLQDAKIQNVTQFTNPDRNNFAPQLGFAWSPSRFREKLVIRGGGGIGYDRLASALFSNSRFAPPNAARYSICCGSSANLGNTGAATGTIQFVKSTNGTIYGYPRNPTLGGGFGANGGPNIGQVEIYSTPANLPNAFVYRYSMEAQYQLPGKFVASAAYQGSKGSRFVRILPLHQLYSSTTAPTFRLAYFASPDVNTSYNALVTNVRRNFSKSFSMNANYRFAKSLDTVSVEAPCACTNQTYSYDNGEEKGPSDFDVTHYFNVSGTWEPSWFKGQKNVGGDLLYGWSFSPIVTWRGGFPWTPVVGGGIRLSTDTTTIGTIRPRAYYGVSPAGNSNADYMAGGQFPGNLIFTTNASGALVQNACNNIATTPQGCSKYFLTPLNGTTFQTNVPGIGRNVFRGPRYVNVDLSIAKRVSLAGLNGFLGESARLDIRFNFFNLLNNLNFAPFNAFSNSTRVDNAQFGVPTAALAGRVGEFQARFSF